MLTAVTQQVRVRATLRTEFALIVKLRPGVKRRVRVRVRVRHGPRNRGFGWGVGYLMPARSTTRGGYLIPPYLYGSRSGVPDATMPPWLVIRRRTAMPPWLTTRGTSMPSILWVDATTRASSIAYD